jgi:hypothetical protein
LAFLKDKISFELKTGLSGVRLIIEKKVATIIAKATIPKK